MMSTEQDPTISSSHRWEYADSKYKYTSDRDYFDPGTDSKILWHLHRDKHNAIREDKPPQVALATENFRPREGKSWANVRARLRDLNQLGQDKARLIYITRHGNAGHNAAHDLFGRATYYKHLAHDEEFLDPELSVLGKSQAQRAGLILANAIQNDGAPYPKIFYTSPLKRCPETAVFLIGAIEELQECKKHAFQITISDKLREWLGINHKHTSDQRSTLSQLRAHMKSKTEMNLKQETRVIFDHPFSERDLEFDLEPLVEAHVEVEQRIRACLDRIFTEEPECIHMVLNNRSFVAFARAIGHGRGKNNEIHMANCATLAFLVTREELAEGEISARKKLEENLMREEICVLNQEKERLLAMAAEEIAGLPKEIYEELNDRVIKLKGSL